MYFVDREKIGDLLSFIEDQIGLLETNKSWESPIEKLALERIAQTIIEAILDVGNGLIDGFIMRDPGSYSDIIDILADEKVITMEMADHLKIIIEFRKEFVQDYYSVHHEKLLEQFLAQLETLKQFAPCVTDYLEKELGPVNAFKN